VSVVSGGTGEVLLPAGADGGDVRGLEVFWLEFPRYCCEVIAAGLYVWLRVCSGPRGYERFDARRVGRCFFAAARSRWFFW